MRGGASWLPAQVPRRGGASSRPRALAQVLGVVKRLPRVLAPVCAASTAKRPLLVLAPTLCVQPLMLARSLAVVLSQPRELLPARASAAVDSVRQRPLCLHCLVRGTRGPGRQHGSDRSLTRCQ